MDLYVPPYSINKIFLFLLHLSLLKFIKLVLVRYIDGTIYRESSTPCFGAFVVDEYVCNRQTKRWYLHFGNPFTMVLVRFGKCRQNIRFVMSEVLRSTLSTAGPLGERSHGTEMLVSFLLLLRDDKSVDGRSWQVQFYDLSWFMSIKGIPLKQALKDFMSYFIYFLMFLLFRYF